MPGHRKFKMKISKPSQHQTVVSSASESLIFVTDRLNLQILDPSHAERVTAYLLRNRTFHQAWFPERDDTVFTVEHQREGPAL